MAQSTDYVLDNQTPAALRAELNQVLSAIATHNSGSVAPTTTYPFMEWEDTSTTPATIRRRNSANSAWVVDGVADTTNRGFITANNPTLTGVVTVPTLAAGTNSTAAASTAFVRSALATHGNWFSITPQNGWVTAAQYRLLSTGDVQIRGQISNAAPVTGQILFNLPVGFRPNTQFSKFSIASELIAMAVVFDTNGNATLNFTGTSFLNIDLNMTFPIT
jgi:hypothetical protein